MSQSHEEVALALLQMIAVTENKRITVDGSGSPANRAWVLSTYRQCLKAVKQPMAPEGAAAGAPVASLPRAESSRAA